MNIFYLDSDVKTCAQAHVDRHVVKMIVEYAQLLSTAHRVLDGTESIALSKSGRRQKVWTLDDDREDNLYKASHINHPSARWARHCASNYYWLMELWLELLDEYHYRYGKHHATGRLIPYISRLPNKISTMHGFSPPWRAMPDQFKVSKSNPDYCVESYRAYYNGAKTHIFRWKNRQTPKWIIQNGTSIS